MGSKRKTFSPSFKAKVAIEAIREEKSISELSTQFEVHPNMIRAWKKQFLSESESIFVDKRKSKNRKSDSEQDPDQLFKQIGQLKVENDFLKKKLGLED